MLRAEKFVNRVLTENGQIINANRKREIIALVYIIYWLGLNLSKFSKTEVQLTMIALTSTAHSYFKNEPQLGITTSFLRDSIRGYSKALERSTSKSLTNLGSDLVGYFMRVSDIDVMNDIDDLDSFFDVVSMTVVSAISRNNELSIDHKVTKN